MSDPLPIDRSAADHATERLVRAAREVLDLVRDAPFARVRLRGGGLELEIDRLPADALAGLAPGTPSVVPATLPAARPSPAAPDATPDAAAPAADVPVVRAPVVGVFYCSPAPGQPPFVKPGDRVEPGDQTGIVEAMKLMNPVVAEHAGIVRAVLVDDGEVVEFDQPLVVLEPC